MIPFYAGLLQKKPPKPKKDPIMDYDKNFCEFFNFFHRKSFCSHADITVIIGRKTSAHREQVVCITSILKLATDL